MNNRLNALLSILAIHVARGAPISTCVDQAPCFDFTIEKMAASKCSTEKCEWLVCLTFNKNNVGCEKDDAISHFCAKREDMDTACQMDVMQFDGLTGKKTANVAPGSQLCQTVKAETYASWVAKDGNNMAGCGDPASRPVMGTGFDNSHQVACQTIPNLTDQCAGKGPGNTASCAWTFKTPACGTSTTGGDPHISRWGHLKRGDKRYSFHGQCDLVYMCTPNFHHGLGLDLHIRTKINRFFSFIESVALKIGDNTLEIHSGGVARKPHRAWMNGQEISDEELPIALEGFVLTMEVDTNGWDTYVVTLPVGDQILFHVLDMYITIETMGSSISFEDTVGLKGDYNTGDLLARDGLTKMDNDTDAFGQEWQVRDTDPQLFLVAEFPQWPENQCVMTRADEKRSLEDLKQELDPDFVDQAEIECAHVSKHDHSFCMYDVLATQELKLAKLFQIREE